MSTIGSGYHNQDLGKSQGVQTFKNSKASTLQSKRRASDSPYTNKHFKSVDLNNAQIHYKQPVPEQLTESKHGTARFNKASATNPLDRASPEDADF